MDAHAATIRVAVLAAEGGRPEEWQLTNDPKAVTRLAQRLKRMAPGPVVACYEAGPGGFALQRQLEAPSFCYLLSDEPGEDAVGRLSLVERNHNGFDLAQAVLETTGSDSLRPHGLTGRKCARQATTSGTSISAFVRPAWCERCCRASREAFEG